MRTKKGIWTLVAIVCAMIVVAGIVFVGFHHRQSVMAQQRYEDRIHEKLADMNTDFAKVKAQKNDAKRLAELKTLTQAYTAYRHGDERDKQILARYRSDLNEEKQYFVAKNAAALKASTLDAKQLASAKKKQLQANDHALAALLKVAKSERSVVYTDKQLKKLTAKIKALRKSYAAQLKKLAKPKADKQASDENDAATATDTSASASSDATTADTDADASSDTTATDTTDSTGVTGSGTDTSGNTGSSYTGGYTGGYSGTTGSRSGYTTSRYRRWRPSRSTGTTTTAGTKASSTTGTTTGGATGDTEAETPDAGATTETDAASTVDGGDVGSAGTADVGE